MIAGRAAPKPPCGARRAMIAAGIALATLGLASCAVVPAPLDIDATADGSRILLAPGQSLQVTLDTNPASGYRWKLERGAASVLEPVGQPLYTPVSPSAPLVGAGGTMQFEFRAAAAGRDTLEIAYRRIAKPDADPARSVRVEVEVR